VVGTPAGGWGWAPLAVRGGWAAHRDQGVDGGGAADHLAARIVEAAAVEPLLRLGLEHPVRARIADGEEVADRDVEPDPVVVAAGFEQQHARCWIGGEPVRQHAAGRARADDDVVVLTFEWRCVGHGIEGPLDRESSWHSKWTLTLESASADEHHFKERFRAQRDSLAPRSGEPGEGLAASERIVAALPL